MSSIPSYRLGDVPGSVGPSESGKVAKQLPDKMRVKQGNGSPRSNGLRRNASSIGSFMQKLKAVANRLTTWRTNKYQKPVLDLLVPHGANEKVDAGHFEHASDPARMLNRVNGQAGLDNLEKNKDLLKTKMGWRTPSTAADRQNMRTVITGMLLNGASRDEVKQVRDNMRNALNNNPRVKGKENEGPHVWIRGMASRFRGTYDRAGRSGSTDQAASCYRRDIGQLDPNGKGVLSEVARFNAQYGPNPQRDFNTVVGNLPKTGLM